MFCKCPHLPKSCGCFLVSTFLVVSNQQVWKSPHCSLPQCSGLRKLNPPIPPIPYSMAHLFLAVGPTQGLRAICSPVQCSAGWASEPDSLLSPSSAACRLQQVTETKRVLCFPVPSTWSRGQALLSD